MHTVQNRSKFTELLRATGALSGKGRLNQQQTTQGYGHTSKLLLSDKNEDILQKQSPVRSNWNHLVFSQPKVCTGSYHGPADKMYIHSLTWSKILYMFITSSLYINLGFWQREVLKRNMYFNFSSLLTYSYPLRCWKRFTIFTSVDKNLEFTTVIFSCTRVSLAENA